jgi:pSer/pThr/pTyr-binding forkhead associated (FHA) protein
MPVIKVNDQQFLLRPGQTRLGSGSDADVRLVGDETDGVQAIVEVSGSIDGAASRNGGGRASTRAVIRRAGDNAAVRINGVSLGVEPVPLIHGDKVEIGGQELLYSDETKAGATELIAAEEIAALAKAPEGSARATAASGGRLVSLVDGKEYEIPATGIVIGRDAGSDVVVAQSDVSRKHAEIVPVANGYEVRDRSTNGLLVNGARVDKAQVLARADVIKIGSEEFRFYADPLPSGKDAPAPAIDSAPPPPVAQPVERRDSGAAATRRAILAVLEVGSGATRGPIHELTTPVAHIGRGNHNDVVINEDSVSDSHATMQLRNEGWYVVDLGTTNGTYVNGTRVNGERRLHGSPVVRFGSVTAIFRPRDVVAETRKGGNVLAGADRPQLYNTLATALPPVPGTPAAPVGTEAPEQPRMRASLWIGAILVFILAAALYVLNP